MSWLLDLQLSDLGHGKKSLSEQTDRCLSLAYQVAEGSRWGQAWTLCSG